MKKFHTIHHYGVAFFEEYSEMKDFSYSLDRVFYMGELDALPREKAAMIAEAHPNTLNYYEYSMMPLFKCKGHPGGTENPIHAIERLKSRGERQIDMPYVVIWRIFDFCSEEPPKGLTEDSSENDWKLYNILLEIQKGEKSVTEAYSEIKSIDDK